MRWCVRCVRRPQDPPRAGRLNSALNRFRLAIVHLPNALPRLTRWSENPGPDQPPAGLHSTSHQAGPGQERPSENATARRRSREPRPRICRSSLSNAIPSVDRNRATCSPGQENTRGTTERDQVSPAPYLSCLAVLDQYQGSQNQEALRRLVSLRIHARQSRTRLSFCRRYKRDPAALRNECFPSKIPKLCRWSVEILPRQDFAASFPERPCTRKRRLAMPVCISN